MEGQEFPPGSTCYSAHHRDALPQYCGVSVAERNKIQDDSRCALIVDMVWHCTADKAEGINKLHSLRLEQNEDGYSKRFCLKLSF